MSPEQNVVINLILAGKNRTLAGIAEVKTALGSLSTATHRQAQLTALQTRRAWALNQALFTMRRVLFGLTVGFLAMGVVILKWGFDFNKQMNEARVGLEGFIGTTQEINKELTDIYRLAAITPFNFPEILQATRRLIPYNQNLQEVNSTVEALTNTLSAQGVASNQYLTRATLQFAHILALGRVTGQQVNALARDNIPLTIMLAHYYGVSTARVQELVKQGLVPAADATKALIAYQKTAGYEGKNFAMATRTLSGAWATFQDIMRFSVGRGEQGLFNKVRVALTQISLAMLPLIKGNKPITIYMIAQALDTALSPKTHVIIYLFSFFKGLVEGLVGSFYVFFMIINRFMRVFNKIPGVAHHANIGLRLLGILTGILIARTIIWTGVMFAASLMSLIYAATVDILSTAWLYYTFVLSFAGIVTVGMAAAIAGIIVVILLLVVGLVVLYFRWKRFHDIVNRFASWLYSHWYVLSMIPVFGPMIEMIVVVIRYWDQLSGAIKKAYDWAVRFRNAVRGEPGHKRWYQKSGLDLIRGAFAGGGTANMAGSYLVGERGPEVVHLPRGATVSPNAAMAGAGSFALTIEPAPVIIDGRKFAEIIFKHRLDRIARR